MMALFIYFLQHINTFYILGQVILFIFLFSEISIYIFLLVKVKNFYTHIKQQLMYSSLYCNNES
jgi:hypothetical protein